MSRKFNADILGQLSTASTDDLTAAKAAIAEDGQAIGSQPHSQENLQALRDLIAAGQQIEAELTARAALADETAAALADVANFAAKKDKADEDKPATKTDEPADKDTADEASDDDTNAADQPGKEVQEAVNELHGDNTKTPENTGDEKEGTVTASANRRPLGAGGVKPASSTRAIPKATMRTFMSTGYAHKARRDVDDINRESVARAFADALRDNNVSGLGRQKVPVINAQTEFPESRMLLRTNAFQNLERVEAAQGEARSIHARDNMTEKVQVRSGPNGANALTAAGFCAPLEVLYDIRVLGDTDRPVRDALTRFGAERGGITYRPALNGVTQTGGIGVWDADDDEADPLVPKTCVEIDCPAIVTAEVEAIYQCLTFSNMSTRFDPEWMDSVVRAQAVAHARFAENRLLSQLTTASKDVYSTQVLGATRDVLVTLDHMLPYIRSTQRLNDDQPMRWIAPHWARNLMRADITRQMVGDGLQALAVTDAEINSWLAERNVNVTWHLDGIDPADITAPTPDVVVPAQFYTVLADESAVPGFPDAISSLFFPEGDWLYLDGGTLDMGVVRDSVLNGQNRFQTFSEEFGFPAFRGIESIHLVMQVNPTGQSAATKDTSALVD